MPNEADGPKAPGRAAGTGAKRHLDRGSVRCWCGVRAALAGCVKLIAGGAQPRLVDVARYRGQPASIIVLPLAGGMLDQVWVVGAGCSATSRDVVAHTLLAAG